MIRMWRDGSNAGVGVTDPSAMPGLSHDRKGKLKRRNQAASRPFVTGPAIERDLVPSGGKPGHIEGHDLPEVVSEADRRDVDVRPTGWRASDLRLTHPVAVAGVWTKSLVGRNDVERNSFPQPKTCADSDVDRVAGVYARRRHSFDIDPGVCVGNQS
jgi:hypothetical protein